MLLFSFYLQGPNLFFVISVLKTLPLTADAMRRNTQIHCLWNLEEMKLNAIRGRAAKHTIRGMLSLLCVLVMLPSTVSCMLKLYEGKNSTPLPRVGASLQALLGQSASCPWVNLMRCAPAFVVTTANNGWVNPATFPLRPDGYPAALQSQRATTILQSQLAGRYPSGEYVISFAGNGTVTIMGDAQPAVSLSGGGPMVRRTFSVSVPSAVGIVVVITESARANPVRNITVHYSITRAAAKSRWNPQWLELVKEFSIIRFTHWQQESRDGYGNQTAYGWNERPSNITYTQVQPRGVSHEEIAELAVTAGVDLFLSIPQRADDDYILQMAKLYLQTGRNVVLEESHKGGYVADPTLWRIPRYKNIRRIWDSVWKGSKNKFELVITCDQHPADCEYGYARFLEPTSSKYDAEFRSAVDAFAISGVTQRLKSYDAIATFVDDVRRVAWEQMVADEENLFAFIARMALLDLPVYAYEGGVVLAVDMLGSRFSDPNSTAGILQNKLEENFRKTERSNDPMVYDLWLEWMERWYRSGGSLFIAGQLVSQGIECRHADTGITNANRWQCNYLGLTRYVEDQNVSFKLRAVRDWKTHSTPKIDMLLAAPVQPVAPPKCNRSCVWGDCDTTGACRCHNGYSGSSCTIFSATSLPNRCSPNDYGVNIGSGADWEPIWIWTNFMNFARRWGFQPVTQPSTDRYGFIWDYSMKPEYPANPFPRLTDDGYPTRLMPNDAVNTFLRRDTYEYPHGLFHVFYDGEGIITFGMDTHVVRRVANGHCIVRTIPVRQLNNGLWFQIRRTNPDDPIRNIKVIPVSMLASYRWQTFHPLFLDSLKRYKVIRFMTPQLAHEHNVSRWSDRTSPTFYSQTVKDGISIEHVVKLSNILHVRPWINIPYGASDEYVSSQAKYVKKYLNPRLTPIVEYSNEVWADHHNVGFYAEAQAVKRGLASAADAVIARSCWVQNRSREIWRIYRANGVNITRVLAGQAATTRVLREALRCARNVSLEVDAIAIAPYFGVPLTAGPGAATLDEVFAMVPRAINDSANMVAEHRQLATEFGIRDVFTYEAGPEFFGGARPEDPDVVALGTQVHRDARMRGAIKTYFDAMRRAGSTLNAYFTAPAGQFGRYGAFGMREYQNQDPKTAVKFQGYEDFAKNSSCKPLPDASGCPLKCSGHGTCLPGNVCECYMSWRGDSCAERWRIPDINGCNKYTCEPKGGTCQITTSDGFFDKYSCTNCSSGWTGWDCQTPACTANCSFNGRCISPQTCECYRGHKGQFCDIDCGCSGHGVCASTSTAGSCTCDAGYKLVGGRCTPSCKCSTCLAPNVCGCTAQCVYGACWDGKCVCWDGFSGPLCQNMSATKPKSFDSPMGINVAGVADWTSATEFLNYMFRARHWFLQPANVWTQDTRWGLNEPVTLTSDGYPAFLPHDRKASTFIMRDTMYIPGGKYLMTWDGQGKIEVGMGAVAVRQTQASGFMEVMYTPSTIRDNGFYISITATNRSNPIRNMRIYSPAFPEDAYARNFIFHPDFLADLRPYRVLRFMDWFELHRVVPNGASRSWSKRKRPDDASMATGYGVSEEIMISLCNWVGSEPWISVPHDADDNYVRKLATLFFRRLRPDVGIHVEHSNEVWNTAYESYKYAARRGRLQFPNITNDGEAAALWHGLRSQQIFTIFQDVFGPLQRNRLNFKLGTFVLSTWHTERSLSMVTATPLAVAITTYFCDEMTFGGSATAQTQTVSQLVTQCRNAATDNRTYEDVERQVRLARARGLTVEAYEGGPSLVQFSAMMGGYPAPGAEQLYRSLHLHQDMSTIVQMYFDRFTRSGVGFINYFTSAAKPSIYGHFGIKESTAASCSLAPKCSGTLNWTNANRNSSAREITWAMHFYGIYNVLHVMFVSRPTEMQIGQLVQRLAQKAALPSRSMLWQWWGVNATNVTSTTSITLTLRVTREQSQQNVTFRSQQVRELVPSTAVDVGMPSATASVLQPADPVITPQSALPPGLK